MRNYRDRYAHHLLLKMPGAGCDSVRSWLRGRFPSGQGDFFECTPDEAAKAFLHRFAVAYAAVRYRAVHGNEVEDIVALDFALPRNARDWTETLPAELDRQILHRLYYGHFFCHVFHHDYVVAMGHDTRELEHALCRLLDERGIEYPAEHNVGHLYTAKPALAGFYLGLDPCNQFNPGLGHTSRRRNWGS
jgi:D-lactate dehydrogenase